MAWPVNLGIFSDGNANLVANLEAAIQPTNVLSSGTDETANIQRQFFFHAVRLFRERVITLAANPRNYSAQYPEVADSCGGELLSVKINLEYGHSVFFCLLTPRA